jgi:hypothetical protein
MIQTQDACIQSLPSSSITNKSNDNDDDKDDDAPATPTSSYKQVQTLPDGTVRHTIATKTIYSELNPFLFSIHNVPVVDGDSNHNNNIDVEQQHSQYPASCQTFDAAATIFRTTTNHAIMAFAQHLSQYMESTLLSSTTSQNENENRRHTNALLNDDAVGENNTDRNDNDEDIKTNVSSTFQTFYDIVQNGVHLEHFHSYVIPSKTPSSSSSTTTTLQLHTDQGLFLVFTPGRYANTGTLTNGFYITIPSTERPESTTTTTEVQFTNDDTLIFMLGDGVNQYINPYLQSSSPKLRAVPHSLQLSPEKALVSKMSNNNNNNRIWYGVMILPPSNAKHPIHTDLTYGELRHGLIHDYDTYVHLACSNTDTASFGNIQFKATTEQEQSRMLQEGTNVVDGQCNNVDEIYCWHRCMNVTEYHVSVEYCDESFRILSCINPRDELWSGKLHGDYYPGCIDPSTAVNETEFPKLPDYPRTNENDVCNTNFQSKFNDGTYMNSIYLENGDGAIFQYTVVDGSTVKGRLIFNGIFGYLGIGFAGEVGAINFMSNGRVIMATRGDEFSPRFGLDLSLPNAIHEYIIDPIESSFRIWGERPYVDGTDVESTLDFDNSNRHRQLKEYNVMTDECYTILTFTTNTIADRSFRLDGTDTMIWAANNIDTYMQYHGNNRGVFIVDWTTRTTLSPTPDSTTSSSTAWATTTTIFCTTTTTAMTIITAIMVHIFA